MNMMGGSVKSDGGIQKSLFSTMADLCHIKRGNIYELDWPTPPYTLLFNATFYLIIGLHDALPTNFRTLLISSVRKLDRKSVV